MQEIYSEEIQILKKKKAKLERELEIKLSFKENDVFVEGRADQEYTAIQVIQAINTGFSLDYALQLKDEDNLLQIVHIKDLTKRHDLERIRARIIGTEGRTLQTLHNLTNCAISLKDNQVGIIGNTEDIEDAIQAIQSIIHGSKQGNVYARIEKNKKKRRIRGKIQIKDELDKRPREDSNLQPHG